MVGSVWKEKLGGNGKWYVIDSPIYENRSVSVESHKTVRSIVLTFEGNFVKRNAIWA